MRAGLGRGGGGGRLLGVAPLGVQHAERPHDLLRPRRGSQAVGGIGRRRRRAARPRRRALQARRGAAQPGV